MSVENAPVDLTTTDAAFKAFDELFPNGLPEDSGEVIPEKTSAAAESGGSVVSSETPAEPEESVTGISDSSPETDHVVNLVKMLKDPDLAPGALKSLSKLAGLTKEEVTSSKTPGEDIIEGLGEEFEYLGKKLAPAIEKAIKRGIDEGLANERKVLSEIQNSQVEKTVTTTLEKFAADNPGSEAFQGKMNELAQQLKPNGLPLDKYLDVLAKASGYVKPSAKPTGPKTPTLDNGVQPQVKSVPTGNMTVKDAAELAWEQVMKQTH